MALGYIQCVRGDSDRRIENQSEDPFSGGASNTWREWGRTENAGSDSLSDDRVIGTYSLSLPFVLNAKWNFTESGDIFADGKQ